MGTVDLKDFYSFTVGGSDPTGVLTGAIAGTNNGSLGGAVTVNLLKSNGTVLSTKMVSGSGGSLFSNKTLAAGQYFLEVTTSEASINYSLSLSASSIADGAGNTFNSATGLILKDYEIQTLSDFVGPGDIDDYYKFDYQAIAGVKQTVTLKLGPTGGGPFSNPAQTIELFDPNDSLIYTRPSFPDPAPFDTMQTLLYDLEGAAPSGTYKFRISDAGESGIRYDLLYSLPQTPIPTPTPV